jgi:hypothetical protein
MRPSSCMRRHALFSGTWGATFRAKTLSVEPLETRTLLSASSILDSIFANPVVSNAAQVTNSIPTGYTPSQIRSAYGFDKISFGNGAVHGDGSGQTIAIVDAYNDPNIASDLQVFDQKFGISDPPSFTKVNQTGGASMPQTSSGWSEEIALDVEWAHAIAPKANILLVEASSNSLNNLLQAVDTARSWSGVSVVSMSWGSGEFSGETASDQHFTTPSGHAGVTFLASAGDNGAQAEWPAISPNVGSVGGTSLSVSGGNYGGESAWSGSGGGSSSFESEPTYQSAVQSTGRRTGPDVAYNANPNTGFAVYDSVATGGQSGWFEIGGTSAGAPQWAALFAIADQGRALAGQGSIANGQSQLYKLSSSDFHDITSGSNGNSARAGYDLVTGRGAPVANLVVADLVSGATATTNPNPPTSTPTQPAPPTQHHYHIYYEIVYIGGRYWLVEIISYSAVNASQPDDISQGLAQVNTALADAGTTSNVQAANTAPAASDFTGSPSSPLTPSLTTTTLAMAPQAGGAAGSLVTTNDAAGTQDSPSIPGMNPSSPTNDAPVEKDGEAPTLYLPATEAVIPTAGIQRTSISRPVGLAAVSGLALDACLADSDWVAGLGEVLVDIPDIVFARTDYDLLGLALGLAIAANVGRRPMDVQPRSAVKPRRQLCRLDRN